MRVGTASVLVKAQTGQYNKDLKKAETRTAQFGKRASSSISSVSSSFASLAGIAGIGGLSIALVKSGADFESQMATVRGVMRATEDDFVLLSDAAKLMGETTEWSASQSAEALKYMGMAGYDAETAIAALPEVLDLASAAGMDLGRASDIVTDSLTAMGMGVEDLGRFSDVLTGTTTRANTNLEMMGETLKYSAPIAAQYGYDIEQLAAMTGVLANAGIKASDAGTDLRQAMVRNGKAAKSLGTAQADLVGTLRAAKEAGWGVNEVTKNYGLIASKSVLVLMDQLDAYDKLENTLRDVTGETKALAAIKLDTVAGDFKILKSTIEGVGLAAFEHLKGDLREGIQEVTVALRNNQGEIIALIGSMGEAAKSVGEIGKHIAAIFGTTLQGYNALPTVIQEVGIVGLIFGGAKGRVAIIATIELIGLAQGRIDKLIESGGKVQSVFAPEAISGLESAKERLEELEVLRQHFVNASVVDQKMLGGSAYLEALGDQIDEVEQDFDDLIQAKQELDNALAHISPIIAPIVAPVADGDDQPILSAQAIAGAYESAYSRMKDINQSAYDVMMAKHQEERDKFIELTGDKETAMALYADRMQELNKKAMTLDETIEQPGSLEAEQTAAAIVSAYEGAYCRLEFINQATYDVMIANAKKERDEFIALTGDKETAMLVYAEQVQAINEQVASFDAYGGLDAGAEEKKRILGELRDYAILAAEDEYQTRRRLLDQEVMDLQAKYESDKEMIDAITAYYAASSAEIDRDYAAHMGNMAANTTTLSDRVEGAVMGWASNWSSALNDMVWGAEISFSDILKSFIKMLTEMVIQYAIVKPLLSSLFSLGFSQGGIPPGAGIAAHSNRVVDQPTIFPFARGMGLMGESGSEAIMPLTRMPGGDLGVKAESDERDQKTPVVINIHEGEGTKTSVEQSNDGQVIDILVEQVEGAMQSRINRGAGLAGFFDSRYGRIV